MCVRLGEVDDWLHGSFLVLRGCWLYLATSALCLLAVAYLAGGGSLVFLL